VIEAGGAEYRFDLRDTGDGLKDPRAPRFREILSHQKKERKVGIGLGAEPRQKDVFKKEGSGLKPIMRIERSRSFGHVLMAGLKCIDIGRMGKPAQSDNLHPVSQARAARAAARRIFLSR